MSRHPGEPLYTLEELDDKFKLPRGTIHGIKKHTSGLEPWSQSTMPNPTRLHSKAKYRLSDAKRWWAALPESIRTKARAK